MKHYNDVINGIRQLCEKLQCKRSEKAFTQLEMALAYSIYAIWHSRMKLNRALEGNTEFIDPVDGAREMAIKLLEHIRSHPSLARSVKRKCPGYLSWIEYKWAREEPNRPEWKISLSRGIVVLSMEFARVCMDRGKIINISEDLDVKEEIEIAKAWLSNTIGKEAALGILIVK